MDFIAKLPVEWDELKVLEAKVGDYTILARRNGVIWYLGAITDWDARAFDISFDFLGEGNYEIEFIQDGLNADTRAVDYERHVEVVTKKDRKHIKLASGGGWIARITPMER
jgi:alpha-glucosidase